MERRRFRATENWSLQEEYKERLHERIRQWGERVVPVVRVEDLEESQRRERFFEHLMTSVERDDSRTANAVEAVDEYVREYVEGPGPYGRGGGSIESTMGHVMCQSQFENLFAIFEAGRLSAEE